jgi:hypothetical protein
MARRGTASPGWDNHVERYPQAKRRLRRCIIWGLVGLVLGAYLRAAFTHHQRLSDEGAYHHAPTPLESLYTPPQSTFTQEVAQPAPFDVLRALMRIEDLLSTVEHTLESWDASAWRALRGSAPDATSLGGDDRLYGLGRNFRLDAEGGTDDA